MKPWITLGEAKAPDGTKLVLQQRGEEYVVRAGGHVLMGSRVHGSEESLAELALDKLYTKSPKVLVGGMGLGYTARAFLDLMPPGGRVVVAELTPEVVEWNRGPVAHLANRPLEDPRLRVELGDVLTVARKYPKTFDAIALDVDNGPAALAHRANSRLYGHAGLEGWKGALKTGGRLLIWSAAPDVTFEKVLSRDGYNDVTTHSVPVRSGGIGTARHFIFYGTTRPSSRKRAGPA